MALDNKLMGYVGIPADCWSAGVILYFMLSYVDPPHSDLALSTHIDISGKHPFDYGVEPEGTDWPSSLELQSHDRGSQYWLSSQRNDEVVKRRIIEGDVDFPDEIWGKMPHGELRSTPLPLPMIPT